MNAASGKWLFSAPVDLGAFLGSAALSFLALAIGAQFGWLDGDKRDTPDWTWIAAVLLIDVAHVWSTIFRVYLDPVEFHRRPGAYLLVPVLGLVLGIALYSFGSVAFWRVLAYVAVFHFVRQQYGWVMLYRARCGERDRAGRWIDSAAIYLATIYPLIYWHAHLPRRFWWFLTGDFVDVPAIIERVAAPLYWSALALYVAKSLYRTIVLGETNPGKDIVVATTALCWYVGIVTFNSDYAFTVTNVVIHGVPYLVLVYWYGWVRNSLGMTPWRRRGQTILTFLAAVWILAFVEELFWDRLVWHDRPWLFGEGWSADALRWFLVPLLALPQLTHYILDGLIWKRSRNPEFTLIVPAS